MALLYRHLRVHQIFGANTDVGKTIFATALVRASAHGDHNVLYLKPVSTGDIRDADDLHVRRFSGRFSGRVEADCLFRYDEPVSPHLAALRHGGANQVSDGTLVNAITSRLGSYVQATSGAGHVYVETAGGVHSPTLSGSTQLDAYRPLFFPTILIGDSKLGGISSTISAYESLLLRGYTVDALLLFREDYYQNWEYLTSYFAEKGVPVTAIPPPPARISSSEKDITNLESYYKKVSQSDSSGLSKVIAQLTERHQSRVKELNSMPARTHSQIWWPFVQHSLTHPNSKSIAVIDSAHKDYFSVYSDNNPHISLDTDSLLGYQFDGSASWWTQTLGHSNPTLTLAAARAAGRYGHTIFPQSIHLPALKLAETLLAGPGKDWASRVFYTDNGSTGMEVALKMALRAYTKRYPSERDTGRDRGKKLGVLGLKGSYHGDTIGVMNACDAGDGVYTCEWHESKGFWFDPPSLTIQDGRIVITLPRSLRQFASNGGAHGEDFVWIGARGSLNAVYDVEKRLGTTLARVYREFIERSLDNIKTEIAALVLEPLVMGAGGMIFVDPLFQRVLVDVVRSRSPPVKQSSEGGWSGIPVIFDEVFVGTYRMGHQTTSTILGVHPDIAVYAKMLSGGLVPLATTLAREEIFEAFVGERKDQALLHGHSYTAYPVACEVANETMKQIRKLTETEGWNDARRKWIGESTVEDVNDGATRVWSFWDPEFVDKISKLSSVKEVMTLGCVLAIKIDDGGKGYRSTAAQRILDPIKNTDASSNSPHPFGIHFRTLGDIAYFITSLNTEGQVIKKVEDRILEVLGGSDRT
ncbi:onanonoxo-7-onima-8-eninoihtemlysoneda [Thelephora terrestris]|uniref:Onanonoxo-7-onima-8-eninoihtemlysoneda n=1 Tax=Thelephora terrestris TaxID=56493 RepID=A0A9P6HMS2_9AGAM|nr:onanonoxo-7-onima-8-eninoihtemlysoneda [Thelephora terrestris]